MSGEKPVSDASMLMSDRQQAEHAAATWIAKRDAGSWTPEDAEAFDAWLRESPGHRVAYYRLNGAWQEAGRLKALMTGSEPRELAGSAQNFRTPNERNARFVSRRSWFALAASVVLGATLFFFQNHLLPRDDYSTVVGGLQAVPMRDGSKVTLNTDSEIRVAVTEKERRVELEHGEAFFEVARDPNRPFVVSVAGQRIVAVGTAFSVRRQGNDIQVIVTEGKVRIEVPGKDAALMEPLSAGSVVRTASNEVLVQKKPIAEIEQSLSWRKGLLTFRDTPLADAVAELNRYNTRQIVIEDPAIAALEVGGIFRATNLDPFVNLLEEAFPIRATTEAERIVLRSR
jgi:transmembrane sensor